MVYQFLFDFFLFNTCFSDLQCWGIGITVVTFVLDIYLTFRNPVLVRQEVDNEKRDDIELIENRLASLEHNQTPYTRLPAKN